MHAAETLSVDDERVRTAVATLREAGADFAYLFGSQARGDAEEKSDLDVAAHCPGVAPHAFELEMPAGVDLLILNEAALAIKGRVATEGVLLFESDPVSHVRWLATTRKIYFDEKYRMDLAARDFVAAVERG